MNFKNQTELKKKFKKILLNKIYQLYLNKLNHQIFHQMKIVRFKKINQKSLNKIIN